VLFWDTSTTGSLASAAGWAMGKRGRISFGRKKVQVTFLFADRETDGQFSALVWVHR